MWINGKLPGEVPLVMEVGLAWNITYTLPSRCVCVCVFFCVIFFIFLDEQCERAQILEHDIVPAVWTSNDAFCTFAGC